MPTLYRRTFKASNGWLDKFKNRHGIVFRALCGESAGVDSITVEEWKKRLPTLIGSYSMDNIYNADETGLFFKLLPDRSMTLSKDSCKGGKRSKERYTVLLCSNWSGTHKLKPLVIGMYDALQRISGVISILLCRKEPSTTLFQRCEHWCTTRNLEMEPNCLDECYNLHRVDQFSQCANAKRETVSTDLSRRKEE